MDILFKTQHGSKLYGLDTPESDDDWFVVVDKVPRARKRYAKQTILDGVDTTVVDFGTWMIGLDKGVPQFWEAAFSRQPEIDRIAAFRAGLRAGPAVWETYYRTIKSFALSEGYKHKRHALRLGLNLHDLGRYGTFNPTLSLSDRKFISDMAYKTHEDVYGLALCLAW